MKEDLLENLATSRLVYLSLLTQVDEQDWNKKSGSNLWTVGQQFWHITFGMQFLTSKVRLALLGGRFSLPIPVRNILNGWIARIGTIRNTKEKTRKKYEREYRKIVILVNHLSDADLKHSITHDRDFTSVRDIFAYIPRHTAEHLTAISKILDGME